MTFNANLNALIIWLIRVCPVYRTISYLVAKADVAIQHGSKVNDSDVKKNPYTHMISILHPLSKFAKTSCSPFQIYKLLYRIITRSTVDQDNLLVPPNIKLFNFPTNLCFL